MLNLRTALVCAAIAPAIASIPVQATAQNVSRSGCDTPKTSFRTYDLSASNSTVSTTFIDIPATSVSFTVGGTTKTCLIVVEFSAEVVAANTQQLRIRAVLDGVTGGLPAEVVLQQGGLASNQTAVFSFVGVSPGPHAVKMQFRAAFNGGGAVTVLKRNTLVRHR
jgi:hypothetical protein